MKIIKALCLLVLVASCASNDDITEQILDLTSYIENKTYETGAVIACAGNESETSNAAAVYFYPEGDAENFILFETASNNVDPNNFENYTRLQAEDLPVFNGYLRKFENNITVERWFIVSFEMDGEIKLSNPILIKNQSQPTIFSSDININQDTSQMPLFTWEVNSEADNAIFFEVISNTNNDLISGTYTFETQFQYYNTSNVVLNITNGTPPDLTLGETYSITIMDVSEDNWINEFFINQFTVQ
ncbi:hypothetical protein PW52_00710 [Tamlana sedimentorum]|uniref:Lipoprotein n=1 Tax=Neotamlana sedimentorum TaxID=1435349 RepID=A0A0D7WE84_9FLAO|nr:hypothetical protein [Tamlana sedimentorum]KJD37013.1 hypothetical protein PW52_00710 [Tamlana sedimentorum]